jgi:hypothetical protein
MKIFKTLLAASAMIAVSATASFAGGQQYGTWNDGSSSQGSGSQIINDQINLQNAWSNLKGSFDTVGGDAVAQGSAAGNMIDITTMNNTRVQNSQIVGPQANIGSNVAVDATNVWGSVGISNQVLCNGASVSTDPILTSVQSNQECHAQDPYSSPAEQLGHRVECQRQCVQRRRQRGHVVLRHRQYLADHSLQHQLRSI